MWKNMLPGAILPLSFSLLFLFLPFFSFCTPGVFSFASSFCYSSPSSSSLACVTMFAQAQGRGRGTRHTLRGRGGVRGPRREMMAARPAQPQPQRSGMVMSDARLFLHDGLELLAAVLPEAARAAEVRITQGETRDAGRKKIEKTKEKKKNPPAVAEQERKGQGLLSCQSRSQWECPVTWKSGR